MLFHSRDQEPWTIWEIETYFEIICISKFIYSYRDLIQMIWHDETLVDYFWLLVVVSDSEFILMIWLGETLVD